MSMTPKQRLLALLRPMVHTRDELRQHGWNGRQITNAVRDGSLIRMRRNRYARSDADIEVVAAARAGGALTCLSLMRALGIFVLTVTQTHVLVAPNSARHGLRRKDGCRLHWGERREDAPRHVTSVYDAIRHSVHCQGARAALATLDSLVHHGLVTLDELQVIFADLPARFETLLRLVDGTAASGPETFVRLMLRTLGVDYETQVHIDGVGRVDFVVEGWLIIECDSKSFHEGWEKQQQDRYRDIAAARRGYVTIRPLATDILNSASLVQDSIRDVIAALGPRFTVGSRSQLRKNRRSRAPGSQFWPGTRHSS